MDKLLWFSGALLVDLAFEHSLYGPWCDKSCQGAPSKSSFPVHGNPLLCEVPPMLAVFFFFVDFDILTNLVFSFRFQETISIAPRF